MTEEDQQREHEKRLAKLRAIAIDAELRRGTLPKHIYWGAAIATLRFSG